MVVLERGQTLSEQQARLLPGLEAAFEALEEEEGD